MKNDVVAVALTWDGAQWPVRFLPARARAFLGKAPKRNASAVSTALRNSAIRELRICWVPRFKGGSDVLCEPFSTATGKRLPFRLAQTKRFGDVLGCVYERSATKAARRVSS